MHIEPYRVALEELISIDTALNANMEYISLVNEAIALEDSEREVIESYLKQQYNVPIYNYTHEQLLEQKYAEQGGTKLKGILLTIEKYKQSNDPNEITLEVSKYRANEGAIALEMILTYQEGQWGISDYVSERES
ncbi:type II secretory pathway component PulL [Paenibacillus amylolyticus]|uniref:Type II secretory pathway component PulL n=2 Tax=Paenibacillus amylolyticus TaxID=1451 RepID=A0AAP5LN93_PAEAM|nr:type II secretory pathway component PulL [Paenibacillus amylolyticus]